jgi:hypothetical protein
MKKLCTLTFINSLGSVYINNNSQTSPFTTQLVDGNSLTATCNNYSINSIDYTFSRCDNSPYTTITATQHQTYTAVYTGKPNNSYRSMAFNTSSVGDPIQISWSAHPLDNTSITQYAIYRKVTTQGTPTLIATVSATGASSYSYIDEEYAINDSDNKILLFYDVRAYYAPDAAYSNVYFEAVYGVININTIANQPNNNKIKNEIPTDYSISNYPNPFNPTTISYQMPKDGFVTLKVYDILGKEVASFPVASGLTSLTLRSKNIEEIKA